MSRQIQRLFLLSLVFLLFGCVNENSPRAEKGYLDLRKLTSIDSYSVNLDGEWEYYPSKLLFPQDFEAVLPTHEIQYLTFPHVWNDDEVNGKEVSSLGYATFRLVVALPNIQTPLALKTANVTSAYRLWVNGELVSTTGTVGKSAEEEVPKHSLSISNFHASSTTLEIVLQVSNHHHITGGVRSSLVLGNADELTQRQAISWGISMLLAGALLIFGLYHLGLYLLRRNDISFLWFGMFCTLIGASSTLAPSGWFIDQLISGLSWPLLFKFHLFVVFIEVPCVLLFIASLFPEESNKTMVHLIVLLSVPFSGVLALLPVYQATWLLACYQPIVLLCIGICCRNLYLAVRHGRDGAGILLVGFLLFALTGIHDILYDKRIINSIYLLPFGLLLLILSQSLVLARRFTSAFSSAEKLSAHLEQKNLQLAQMDREKDRFIANTSHELKTPLHGIIGLTESLLDGVAGPLSIKADENLQMVASSARRLGSLVDDLLDISLLEKKDLRLNLIPVDLHTLTETVVSILTPLAKRKHLDIAVAMPKGIPQVLADADRLQQILFNLAGNAIKFTDHGGIRIGATTSKGVVHVTVSDTGMGIPADKIATIFSAFSRIEEAKGRAAGGTGLGLTIAQQLVELHGSDISVDSLVGNGSTFSFTLPAATKSTSLLPVDGPQQDIPGEPLNGIYEKIPLPCPASQLKITSSSIPGSSRVLVVDDEPVNLQVAANVLAGETIEVELATSGQQALDLFTAGEQFDLILLDIMMPGISGYEVCRKLREHHAPSELPIIMVTARTRLDDLVHGFEAGANDYLGKPYANKELLVRVYTLLEVKKAYQTLEENNRLKRELARRAETERELRLMQRRLTTMLDAAPDSLVAVNAEQEIAFINRHFLEDSGYTAEELLGCPAKAVICSTASHMDSIAFPSPDISKSIMQASELMEFKRKDGAIFTAAVVTTPIEVGDTTLYMMALRKQEQPIKADGAVRIDSMNHFPLPETITLVEELHRNQQRVRDLEETLNGSLPEVVAQSPDFTTTIRSIDNALTQMGQLLSKGDEQIDKRRLAVDVMNLSLDYWQKSTGKSKGDLARESAIWKVYTNSDGWDRTQTLDKYLDIKTIPKKPRLAQVLKTGDFVLATVSAITQEREKVEQTLAKLRLVS